MKNYYSILGVSKDADAKQIKQAYRQLCETTHPDNNNGHDARYRDVQEAYSCLSDNYRRHEHDKQLRQRIEGHMPVDVLIKAPPVAEVKPTTTDNNYAHHHQEHKDNQVDLLEYTHSVLVSPLAWTAVIVLFLFIMLVDTISPSY